MGINYNIRDEIIGDLRTIQVGTVKFNPKIMIFL